MFASATTRKIRQTFWLSLEDDVFLYKMKGNIKRNIILYLFIYDTFKITHICCYCLLWNKKKISKKEHDVTNRYFYFCLNIPKALKKK